MRVAEPGLMVLLLSVGVLGHGLLRDGVAERVAAAAAMRAEVAACGERERFIKELGERAEAADGRLRAKRPLLASVRSSLLTTATDRLWILSLHGRIEKEFPRVVLTPEQLVPPPQLASVPVPGELQAEINEVRARYRTLETRTDAGRLEAPGEIGLSRAEWQFSVSCAPQEVFPLLALIQSGPLWMEVISLSLRHERDRDSDEERVAAAITVATPVLDAPAEKGDG